MSENLALRYRDLKPRMNILPGFCAICGDLVLPFKGWAVTLDNSTCGPFSVTLTFSRAVACKDCCPTFISAKTKLSERDGNYQDYRHQERKVEEARKCSHPDEYVCQHGNPKYSYCYLCECTLIWGKVAEPRWMHFARDGMTVNSTKW